MSELLTATGERLTALLLEAPSEELYDALHNESLSEEQLLAMLRRRDLSPQFLDAVAKNQRWATKYLVKSLLVQNPHCPKSLSLNLVKFLFWRDLVKVLSNLSLPAPLRVAADKVLRDRLDDMELGEKITLARMGSREVVKMLRRSHDERIFSALLLNPRLTEEDLLPLLNDQRTPPSLLGLIARSPRWSSRYPLRLALVRNPSTPTPLALSHLIHLTTRDLKEMLENPHIPRLVREAADKLRSSQRRGGRGHLTDRSTGPGFD